ncbi:MAG: glycosyltransferase family 4 protein [Bacteroidetes bacterium]|nr:MAG: glycosyltransferase family 4 protein [Bacteroidota bacterium]
MDDKRLRVLFLSSWYPNRLNPTDGNFNEKFAEAAAVYNDVTAIHVVADKDTIPPFETDIYTRGNVKTYVWYFRKNQWRFGLGTIINGFRYLAYYIKAYKRAEKECGTPRVLHLNVLYPAGIIALVFKFLFGLKYVISEHWTGYLPSNEIKQPLLAVWLSKIIARKAHTIMPVTHNLKEAMMKKGFGNTCTVVPNVVDVKHFYPPEPSGVKKKKVILHVSSLKDEHKNVSGLLRTIKKLSQQRTDFHLKIVGDGDLKPHINYAKELSLHPETVSFHGTMSTQEIAETMRNSDVFVLFSNYENLPCVIIEAFASGLPVISTNVGGISEHLTPDKGVLIPPGGEKALLNAIDTIIVNADAYDKQSMHNYARENFSYEKIGERFTAIYNSVIK